MMDFEAWQTAIIARLKDDDAVVALVGTDVRENGWRGKDFGFPCLRVALDVAVPQGDHCRTTAWDIQFRVIAFSDKESSLEVFRALKAAGAALEGQKVSGTGYTGAEIKVAAARPHLTREVLQTDYWIGEVSLTQYIRLAS